jgi:hypothetical protein
MKQLYILLALLALCSCNQQKVISEAEYNDLIKELGWDQPDSLMSPEQLEIKQKATLVTFENTVVKDNEMHLTVGAAISSDKVCLQPATTSSCSTTTPTTRSSRT